MSAKREQEVQEMNTDWWGRYGAVAGIAFVVLLIVAFATQPSAPDLDAPARKVASYYTDDREGIQLTIALISVALALYVWFLGTLRGLLRAAEGGAGLLSGIAFGAGLVVVAGLEILGMVTAVAAFRPEETGAELTRALNDMGLIGFGVVAPVSAAFFLATAVVVLRTDALPTWLGWLAVLGAATSVLGIGNLFEDSGALSADGFLGFTLGFIVWLVWVLGTSAVMLRRGASAGRGRRPRRRETVTPGSESRA
jgi:hypothetical protein